MIDTMLELRPFQEEAVEDLKGKILKSLKSEKSKIGFKSPTGSGKTIMTAEVIKRVVEEKNADMEVCFIWIAVNKLHLQSKDKLERYYVDFPQLSCVEWENVVRDEDISENHILFFNWSSINKNEINIINKDGESQVGLETKILNTKEHDRKIILIIDESHHTSNTDISKGIIDIIKPDIEISMSATLDLNQPDLDTVVVKHRDVVEQQMIKRKIIVNDVLDKNKYSWDNESVLKIALDKRAELKKIHQLENSNINPLVLIQIPNNTSNQTVKTTRREIEDVLTSMNITTANGGLAIYLSESGDDDGGGKINLDNIDDNDNQVKVLIFKQAIAVGWDCPRAAILVMFRELGNFNFTVQVLGRIMRMPELRHYPQESLNYSYIYTNLDSASIKFESREFEELNYIDELKSQKNIRDNVKLVSEHIERNNERTRLNSEFYGLFDTQARKDRLSEKITMKHSETTRDILVGDIVNADLESKLNTEEITPLIDNELLHKYLMTYTEGLTKRGSETLATKASSEIIMNAVFGFFKDQNINETKAEKLFLLNEENKALISKNIVIAMNEYIKNSKSRSIEQITHSWQIPEMMFYPRSYLEEKYKKSIMQPMYIKNEPNLKTESDFMKFLDRTESVKWWFKNSENHKTDFSIVYVDGNDDNEYTRNHKFYVDFIVKSTSGKIWLLDPKEGSTLTDIKTPFKSDRLFQYIHESPKKINLAGGIVRYSDEINSWVYFNRAKYVNDKNMNDWEVLRIE